MNILISGHHLVVREYQELVQEIAIAEKVVTLVTPEVYLEKKVTYAETYKDAKFKHIKLKTMFGESGRQHAFYYYKLGETISNVNPEIIFCMEEPNSIVSLQFAYYAKKYNIPIVFWSALNQKRDFKIFPVFGIRRYLYPICTNYVFNNSIAINAINQNVADVLRWRGYKKQIIIQNTFGVNKNFFVDSFNKVDDTLNLIYIGVLEQHKGVHILLEAIKNNVKIKLTILGDGSERKNLEQYSMNNNCNTRFLGYVDYLKVSDFLKVSDILILPSLPINNALEQFGRVLIEAMASGTTIIASDLGEIPNTLNGNGLLFEAGNHIALKESIDILEQDSKYLKKLKKSGNSFVKKEYLNKNIASKILKELEVLSIERS